MAAGYDGDGNRIFQVNTENTEVLQEYTQSGNLKSSHVYGNGQIYSDVYDTATYAFNVSTYNYDGRRSVAQTVTDTGMKSQLSYDPFGNLMSGETVGASTYGFNAEESNTLTGLQHLRARYYDTSGGRFITADAHQLKKDTLGKKTDISKYDIYQDKSTSELIIYRKGGKGEGIPTGEFIK